MIELLSPSLFGERRVVVIESAHEARADLAKVITDYAADPIDSTCLVVTHKGVDASRPGSRGAPRSSAAGKTPAAGRAKAAPTRRATLLDDLRSAGAIEVACDRVRSEERVGFVRAEVRRAGGSIGASAAAVLLDAVGSDLREIAAACEQLVVDSGAGGDGSEGAVRAGEIDAATVRRYYRGRAEVTGYAVSDRAVVGDVAGALETLRWALSVGVAHVLIADALADGVRTVAKVAAAGRGNPYQMASSLGLPPWKVKRAQGQARGWTEPGLVRALAVVAAVNADVKGVAVDASYSLEKAVCKIAAARGTG